MYKFIRYFNQNRQKIYRIIIIVVFVGLMFQFLIKKAGEENEQKLQNALNQEISSNDFSHNINTDSAIGEGKLGQSHKEETDSIEQFIQYCNNSDAKSAYNMLSKECKENTYPTLEGFEQSYLKNNFITNKNYKIQLWSNSTYKIDLKENSLHTGIYKEESKQDFITVVEQDNEKKLNINSYIGRTELNVKSTTENMEIKILYKDTYREYETYRLEIKNIKEKDIYLDNLESTPTIYIVDGNGVKHSAYTHELTEEQLHIYPYSKEQIKITFSNAYISNRKISRMVFENVIIKGEEETRKINIEL